MRLKLILLFLLTPISVLLAQSSVELHKRELSFRTGLEMVEKANFSAARHVFESFIADNPLDSRIPDAQYYIAYSALNLYNLDAEQLFVDFMVTQSAHPKAKEAYYDLGSFFYQDKNYDKSIEYLSKVDYNSLSNDQQSDTRFKLAYSYFSKRKFGDALTNFNILKRGSNKYANASSYYAAYIEYYNEDYDAALVDLRKVEQSAAYKSLVPFFICNIYYRQAKYSDLVTYGSSVLSSGNNIGNKRDVYLLTAEGYYQEENYDEAFTYYSGYREGLRTTPNPEVAFRIGRTAYEVGENEIAIASLRSVANRKDEYGATASYFLGFLYLQDKNLEQAASAFQLATRWKDNQDFAEKASFQFAKVSVDLRRSTVAINELLKFKELFPSSSLIGQVDELLSLAYVNSNNLELAIEHMESLGSMSNQVKRSYQQATFMQGNLFFNQRKYRDAVVMYEKSLQNELDAQLGVESRFWLAETYAIGRRFEESIPYYNAVLQSTGTQFTNKAQYGLGYSYFNTKNYAQALRYFQLYVDGYPGSKRDKLFLDGLVRLADCQFVAKNYNEAINLYNRAIRAGNTERGYVYLQIGLVQFFDGRNDDAKSNFQKVIREFPNSPYVDDAMFEYATVDYENGSYSSAIASFTDLINDKPKSPFVPYALQRRATAHYNLQTYGRTEQDYVTFLRQYPTHVEAQNVLLSLQEVLGIQNKSNEFEGHLAAYREANPNAEGLQVVEFETAKNYYNNLEYDKAIQAFLAFSESYPSDYKIHEAKFYMAEAYYRKGENFNALPLYYEVLAENQVNQIVRVIQRIADLEFAERNYTKSLSYYKQLEGNALNNRQLFNSWIGQMKVFFQIPRYDSAVHYADRILNEDPPNSSIRNVATLYKGKDAYVRGNYDGALEYFETTIDNAKDISAAEAKYLIGQILYHQEKYQESNKVLYSMPPDFGVFDLWIGNAGILISDNHIALEDRISARAVLNQIIENTTSGEVANRAKIKLNELDEYESERLRKEAEAEIEELDTIQIELDTLQNKSGNNNEGGNNE